MSTNRSPLILFALLAASTAALSGCMLFAAGAGAEAAYVTTQDDRSVSQTMTDQRITAQIKSMLVVDSETPGFTINVDTFKGNVKLHGKMKDSKAAERAVEIARKVDGVKSVENDIEIG